MSISLTPHDHKLLRTAIEATDLAIAAGQTYNWSDGRRCPGAYYNKYNHPTNNHYDETKEGLQISYLCNLIFAARNSNLRYDWPAAKAAILDAIAASNAAQGPNS